MPRVVIVSPPFLSHARPLSALAAALRDRGAEVFFACTEAFEDLAKDSGARFEPLGVTRNANTGVAETTPQGASESARLAEFLRATRAGAVPALMTQARHRRADMMADPAGVFVALAELDGRLRPDWYVVDQLSYAATLALHCLGLPYATYCPGHPTYVLDGDDAWFGVPYAWPEALRLGLGDLTRLRAVARRNDREFTALFDRFVRERAPGAAGVDRAFALTSPHAVVYAYPRLSWLPAPQPGPEHVYAGHMAGPTAPLDDAWADRLARLRERADRIVLVALGTFLTARDDVVRTVVRGALAGDDRVAVVAAAGARSEALADLVSDRVVVLPSVPQQSLLPHVDAMVHHGGNNSFTECLRAGVPALVLPFSSDQFAIAHDAERAAVGVVRDPNRLAPEEVTAALDRVYRLARGVAGWARHLRSGGPDRAAARLLDIMGGAGAGRAPETGAGVGAEGSR
ncbi:glycosyltransferase [Streptomyces sp. NPDC004111]|uniref:glycosyltransferase n=1 Tax=Streptomyces sp. NPDC004111 TaxID=3364690 RepID=UPI0036C18F47